MLEFTKSQHFLSLSVAIRICAIILCATKAMRKNESGYLSFVELDSFTLKILILWGKTNTCFKASLINSCLIIDVDTCASVDF